MEEERIGLFLDYENLAIGAREHLGGMKFDFEPIASALAERGRIVLRRAYADWSMFDEDRRMLTRHQVELIDIPQRMGYVRKNAADIKMAVDAIELAFERDYVTTFVIATGDSDFTPLMHKLRELNKSVIGIGVAGSTSEMLPKACDEFLFYDRLEGVHPAKAPSARGGRTRRGGQGRGRSSRAAPSSAPSADDQDLNVLITQTLSGLKRRSEGPVLGSQVKRTILRKDPTFDEAEHGFRSFTELLRKLADDKIIELSEGSGRGDPVVEFPEGVSGEDKALELLRSVVESLSKRGGAPPPLSGMKDQLRKKQPGFTEKRFGYTGFLQFARAARAKGVIEMEWDESIDDYVLRLATPAAAASEGDAPDEEQPAPEAEPAPAED